MLYAEDLLMSSTCHTTKGYEASLAIHFHLLTPPNIEDILREYGKRKG